MLQRQHLRPRCPHTKRASERSGQTILWSAPLVLAAALPLLLATVGAGVQISPAPSPSGTSTESVTTSFTIAQMIISFLGGGAISGIATFLVTRALTQSDSRRIALRRVANSMRGLQKQLSIARDFPRTELWAFDKQLADLSLLLQSSECNALYERQYQLAVDVQDACDGFQRLVDAHKEVAGATIVPPEAKADAARAALTMIYTARDAYGDATPVNWPIDPLLRNLWVPNSLIPRS
jgi:hypothetical protein